MDLAAERGSGHGLPPSLRAKILSGTQPWHLFNHMNGRGTVVLMSMRLAHAATPNTGKEMRISWDARFRLQVRDPRPVVYGVQGEAAPHWAECSLWEPKCHLQHVQMLPYVRTMLLVNARLRAQGEPWLLPDLLKLIMVQVWRQVTPRWCKFPEPQRGFGRRHERVPTLIYYRNDLPPLNDVLVQDDPVSPDFPRRVDPPAFRDYGGATPGPGRVAQWECLACTFLNNGARYMCEMCGSARPSEAGRRF